ncbi:efflux RND transporter periplasmic adaptor subunit [Gluconacetobacter tumulisoli]|nr:efflux RND transporter periplasmic adaptor subunit [Gluconacetobacter tumulisoli]
MTFYPHKGWRILPPLIAILAAIVPPGSRMQAHAADMGTAMVRNDHGRLTVADNSPLQHQLTVEAVTAATPRRHLEVPGTVAAEPARTVAMLAPLAGHITTLNVAPGDHVARGQVLAELLSGDMAQATTDETKARAALDLARRALARAQGVAQAGGAATRDVEAARSTLQQDQAEEDRAQARLTALGGQAGADGVMKLVSPVDGTVASVNVAAGGNVTDLTAPLLTVEDLSEIWVVASVPEDEIPLVQPGQQASITLAAWPDQVLHGRIDAIEPVLRADTRTMQARIVLPNPDGALKPNMFATVAIQATQVPGVTVPQSALLMNNDEVTVFVEVAPWTFVRRAITIIYDDGARCRVLAGLKEGERVITRGAVLLNDD